MTEDGARVFTVPPGTAFVDALAEGVLAENGRDPLALSALTILLPTRRAVRSLREAFLRRGGGPLLLPSMRAIGDVDDDELALADGGPGPAAETLDLPPAITDLERQLLLAHLIRKWEGRYGSASGPSSQGQAVRLAGELARFLDQVQTARLSFDRLDGLVEGDLAEHWHETVRFLGIVTRSWPALLASRAAIDPADRRNRLLEALAARWSETPPNAPVIAAGSTGSVPATADLLAVIARLPRGTVVLPGLDKGMDDDSWQALAETHPQYGLKLLLERLDLARGAVADWPYGARENRRAAARAVLASETMRPAATAQAWRELGHIDRDAVAGLRRIDCADSRAEAGVIALLMREALQTEGRTAALVTADRALARRVQAELRRWRIAVDDSAGRPLADTVPGTLLRLCLEALVEKAAPVPLLALLKHPLAAGGLAPEAFRRHARALERACLRGPRPAPGFAGLRRALAAGGHGTKGLRAWLARLAAAARPLVRALARRGISITALAEAHLAFAEWLAADANGHGAARLWAGEASEACAALFEQLLAAAAGLAPIPGAEYPALIDGLLARAVVRPHAGAHPRLAILGPLEARLQRADLVILGGLNEASWPGEAAVDPWLSRPMRRAFGLPQPERLIGLAAHDFAQLLCAPEVVLTRAEKVDGTPSVPSRWLVRLQTVLAGCGLATKVAGEHYWTAWQVALDSPERPPAPVAAPEPRPPLEARPRKLSVTRIERWMRDPYDIFASRILKLDSLEPIDAALGPADFGRYIHRALDRFARETIAALPADALERLLAIGREEMAEAESRPGLWAFLWPRFERIAAWFIDEERARRRAGTRSLTEIAGRLELDAPGGRFTLTATADRIDIAADGTVEIIDYKTGLLPTPKEVAAGFSPQLPLEAAIVRAGGFAGVDGARLGALSYWRLSGGRPAGEIRPLHEPAEALAAEALAGLARLVAVFDRAETPYPPQPAPEHAPRYSDYEHLARVGEWSARDRDERW